MYYAATLLVFYSNNMLILQPVQNVMQCKDFRIIKVNKSIQVSGGNNHVYYNNNAENLSITYYIIVLYKYKESTSYGNTLWNVILVSRQINLNHRIDMKSLEYR